MFVDTHAHLDDEQFDAIRPEVLKRAAVEGVEQIICIGTTAESSRRSIAIADEHPGIYAAVGIQPNYVAEAGDGDWEQIVEFSRLSNVVAVGETGLDHYWDYAGLDLQEEYFRRHVRLSKERKKPFVVHMREPKSVDDGFATPCAEHILRLLQEMAGSEKLSGVMHSYTGNVEMAVEFLQLGLYLSFAGMVTFKNSQNLREVARHVPLERMLVETDAPYLSPQPVRGKRPNEPAHVRHTAACLAEIFDMQLEEFAAVTSSNARKLFDLDRREHLLARRD